MVTQPTGRAAGEQGPHDRAKARAYHGGDLRGVRDHLPYLKDLGVTTVWLTPIVKNGAPEDYHGYGAVDLYSVSRISAVARLPGAGGHRAPAANENPVRYRSQSCRAKASLGDIATAARLVSRHPTASYEFINTDASLILWNERSASRESRSVREAGGPARAARVFTDSHGRLVFRRAADLNSENPVVAQYLLQNAIWWAESSGLDGYRIDTFPYVSRQFWSAWHAGLRKIYPRLTTIGEVFHPDPSVTSFFVGGLRRGDGIDSGVATVFDYPMYFALRDVLLRAAPAGRMADVLRHDSLYQRPDDLITFFANHDVARS